MRGIAPVVAAAVVVAGLWAVGAANPPATPVMQGDELGARQGESQQQYSQRAAATLDHEEASFALVTFSPPVGAETAVEALSAAPRVSALVVPGQTPVVVPEASTGKTRLDVLRSATGSPLSAAVVFATRGQLEQISADNAVLAVEMLPADAVWGAFAITPSTTGGRV